SRDRQDILFGARREHAGAECIAHGDEPHGLAGVPGHRQFHLRRSRASDGNVRWTAGVGDGVERTDGAVAVEGRSRNSRQPPTPVTLATPRMPSASEILGVLIVIFVIWFVLKLA